MAEQTMPVVILAGGSTPEKILATGEKEKERAFLDIGGRPMLAWVLDAFRASGVCGDMLCIGNADRLRSTFGLKPEQVMGDLGSMLDNFMAGMEHFRKYPRVINATCDIPLVTPEALRFVIDETSKMDAEVFYPIVDIRRFDEKFPGGRRTTQALKEGTFTGGNVFVVNPERVLKNRGNVERVIRDRKSPAKLVRMFGLPFILKFALKQLDLKGLEDKATSIMGARMRSVITPYPEIGFDVDKPEDLEMVRRIMGGSVGHA
jgi:molybdopterin-guanine dinucleotide biosynthesis protein A